MASWRIARRLPMLKDALYVEAMRIASRPQFKAVSPS